MIYHLESKNLCFDKIKLIGWLRSGFLLNMNVWSIGVILSFLNLNIWRIE
jgi:hypothetical protein